MMKEGMPSEFIPLYVLRPLIVALTSSAEMEDAVVFFVTLYRAFTSIILRKAMFLVYIMLQLFCDYSMWYT